MENMWAANLAGVQLISKCNKKIGFIVFLLIQTVNMQGLFHWKIKKVLLLLLHFNQLWKKSIDKLNKIWVEKGSEFQNRSMKSWLQKNRLEFIQHIM